MKKRSCIITGSSSGIGRSIADVLRREEYAVLGMQRRAPGIQVDLSRIEDIPIAWNRACHKLQGLPDLLILCAGMPLELSFVETETDDMKNLIHLNLISPLVLAREALNSWSSAQKKGHLIFIGSQAALPGAKQTGNVVYSASKGGIHAVIGPLANEYGPDIRVNAVAPGDVITKTENEILRKESEKKGESFSTLIKNLERSSALGRRVKAKEVAETVLFLDRCEAMTGSIINISAGKSIH